MQIPVIDWNSANIVEETRKAFTHVGGGRFYNIWSEEEKFPVGIEARLFSICAISLVDNRRVLQFDV